MAIYKLGEICKITIGKTPSTKNKQFWINGTINWYTGKDFSNEGESFKKISPIAINENRQTLTSNNSLILSMVRYIKPKIVPFGSAYNQGVANIEPNNNVLLKKYLYYWFYKKQKYIRKNMTIGATFPAINGKIIKGLIINIPSIKDQQKIIDIIEPLEKIQKSIDSIISKILFLIEKIPDKENILYLKECVEIKREKPKGIHQFSAKMMKKRCPLVIGFENPDTYKTNSFFANKNSLLINTIRPNLEKFSIIPLKADVNGTSLILKVKTKHTSILSALLNSNAWSYMKQNAKGTKMPIVSKKDILNLKFYDTFEIPNIFNLITLANNLLLKIDYIKLNLIKGLII